MLDKYARKLMDPPLNKVGKFLSSYGIHANTVTIIGFCVGITAAIAIVFHAWIFALILIFVSRVFDGLDGSVARASQKTDFGGYLDIVLDFFLLRSYTISFCICGPDSKRSCRLRFYYSVFMLAEQHS